MNVPDYMETSALGRAEWVRFYGLLFGKEAEADSLFAGVEEAYLSLRNQSERHNTETDCHYRTENRWYMVCAGGK